MVEIFLLLLVIFFIALTYGIVQSAIRFETIEHNTGVISKNVEDITKLTERVKELEFKVNLLRDTKANDIPK